MKELSAKILQLRGRRSTDECARLAGISKTVYLKIERGEPVRLSSVRAVAQGLMASEADSVELLCAWLKGQADTWMGGVSITPIKNHPSALRDASANAEHTVLARFKELKATDRQIVLKALEHPEILKSLAAINQLYDDISRE